MKMKLYTKSGDDGTTGLADGTRVRKDDLRVSLCGGIDEANAAIGVALAECRDQQTRDTLGRIQSDLFALGADLSRPNGGAGRPYIDETHVSRLEGWIDAASEELAPLRNFVLPGGCAASAGLHLARAVSRRAERAAVALSQRESVSRPALIYLNRLSDLLFALALRENQVQGVAEIPWRPPQR